MLLFINSNQTISLYTPHSLHCWTCFVDNSSLHISHNYSLQTQIYLNLILQYQLHSKSHWSKLKRYTFFRSQTNPPKLTSEKIEYKTLKEAHFKVPNHYHLANPSPSGSLGHMLQPTLFICINAAACLHFLK